MKPAHREQVMSWSISVMVDVAVGRGQSKNRMALRRTPLRRLEVTQETPLHPAYVVWELTLACDQPCTHCGSRAGEARQTELSTEAALKVIGELAAAGAREVVLIGGEAYLHPGFLDIVAALARAGIRPTLTTGGRGITPPLAASMAARRAAHGVGQHRRSRADARSDAGLSRKLRLGHRRAGPPARGRRADGGEHQHQPAQRRRARGALRPPGLARDHRLAGADHRAARSRGRSPRSPAPALGSAGRRSARDRAEGQGAAPPASW